MIRVFEIVVLYLRNRLIYKQPKHDNCLLIVLQRIPVDLRGRPPRYLSDYQRKQAKGMSLHF